VTSMKTYKLARIANYAYANRTSANAAMAQRGAAKKRYVLEKITVYRTKRTQSIQELAISDCDLQRRTIWKYFFRREDILALARKSAWFVAESFKDVFATTFLYPWVR